jgi:CDGSH-type Zn-finger protein
MEGAMPDVTIEPTTNGPYKVSGPISLADPEGNEFEVKGVAFLCRCGGSSNKPFCDGTHAKIDFLSEVSASEQV